MDQTINKHSVEQIELLYNVLLLLFKDITKTVFCIDLNTVQNGIKYGKLPNERKLTMRQPVLPPRGEANSNGTDPSAGVLHERERGQRVC